MWSKRNRWRFNGSSSLEQHKIQSVADLEEFCEVSNFVRIAKKGWWSWQVLGSMRSVLYNEASFKDVLDGKKYEVYLGDVRPQTSILASTGRLLG